MEPKGTRLSRPHPKRGLARILSRILLGVSSGTVVSGIVIVDHGEPM